MKIRDALLRGAALMTVSSIAGHAYAETGTSAPTAQPATLGEVVVTATRREESLQKVPESIIALTQRDLTQRGIVTSFDLQKAVPGLNVTASTGNNSMPTFAVRGRGGEYGAAAGSVETYFDDVPLSGPFQMPTMGPQFFDLQSVQVLKGPQGTLFGRSTTGGAVLFVPQAPTSQFGGYVRVQGGDYGDFQIEGAVNVPILPDKLELRLAGFDWTRDGYGHTLGSIAGASPITGPYTDPFGKLVPPQTYDNQDVQQYRATLLMRPTDKLSNSTVFAYNSINDRTTPKVTIVNPATALGGGILFLYPDILKLGPYTANIDTNLAHKADISWALINTTTYDITDALLLKNIFGYINSKGYANSGQDDDGTPLAVIDGIIPSKQDFNYQTTDELQLQGQNFDNRLSWIVGGIVDDTEEPGGDNINIFSDTFEGSQISVLWQQNTFHDYSVFGSATYKLTDQISVTAGERHNWYNISTAKVSGNSLSVPRYLANTDLTPSGAVAAGWVTSRFNHTSQYQGDAYNIGIQDQVDPRMLVYGGYRRGYKPGGFNASSPIGANEDTFAPETDDDFYAGLKKEFTIAGMPARFDVEGYWDLYQDKQTSYLTETPAALATVTLNIPNATYRGIDLDLVVDPTAWLRVNANYSYIDAFNTKWPDPTCPIAAAPGTVCQHLNLANNPVAFVSPNKVSATFRFHTDLRNNLGEVVAAPSVSYQDKSYVSSESTILPQGESSFLGDSPTFNGAALGGATIPAYALVDLRFEWNHIGGSNIDGAINVTNVTNVVYRTGGPSIIELGEDSYSFGPPRMVNVEFSTRF